MDLLGSCFRGAYRGKKVWVSGHTGFKGAWLCEWLLALGAKVTGFSQMPPTEPSLFDQLGLEGRIERSECADIRDRASVAASIARAESDFVFHLAAQPIVRRSYEDPEETWDVNVSGTIHVLEALRIGGHACTAVVVTSDKCYENRESGEAYSEDRALGGHDPYSASKGAVELAVASWRRSFFLESGIRLMSGRAGNVIGGGDWARDRIVPDCIRALRSGHPIRVRNRNAMRPWQHVLEPLSGYLWMASEAAAGRWAPRRPQEASASAVNFGPDPNSSRSVAELVEELVKRVGGEWVDYTEPGAVHEAKLLGLSIAKAREELGWRPVWGFEESVEATARWYLQEFAGNAVRAITLEQIAEYCATARDAHVPWAEGEA